MKKSFVIALSSFFIGIVASIVFFNNVFGNRASPRYLAYSESGGQLSQIITVVPKSMDNTIVELVIEEDNNYSLNRVSDIRFGSPRVYFYAIIDNVTYEIRNPVFTDEGNENGIENDDLSWLINTDNFNKLIGICCSDESNNDILNRYVALLTGTNEIIKVTKISEIDSIVDLHSDRYLNSFETIGIKDKFISYSSLDSSTLFWTNNMGIIYVKWDNDIGIFKVLDARIIGQLGIEVLNL